MAPANQTIEFEGYFAEGVLGIFKIIRGFADLRDLAAISVPYQLSYGAEPGQVIGHQRRLNAKHARKIKKYLEQSDSRLIPEVILSLLSIDNDVSEQEKVIGVESELNAPVAISRCFSSKHQRIVRDVGGKTFHLAERLAFEWTQWLMRSYTHDLHAVAWRMSAAIFWK